MSAKNSVKTEKTIKSNGLFGFFREVKVEVKKITWPSKMRQRKHLLQLLCSH